MSIKNIAITLPDDVARWLRIKAAEMALTCSGIAPDLRKNVPMNIEILEERNNDVLVLLPVDRIDSTNARSFETIITGHIGSGQQRMIIDFGRLNFISSSGLRVLLIAAKKLGASQGKLVLCRMQPHIHEVFTISGFDQLIPIQESRKAALNLF